MTILIDAARKLAEDLVASYNIDTDLGVDLVLNPHPILTGSYGWVFAYQNRAYLDSGSFSDQLAGNAPILVDRQSSEVHTLGTVEPIEFYVRNFVEHGDPHFQTGCVVEINGWKVGAKTISAIKLVRHHTNLGLKDAKFTIEECLSGRPQSIECKSVEDAKELTERLKPIGWLVNLTSPNGNR